jgi:hypothetical protein
MRSYLFDMVTRNEESCLMFFYTVIRSLKFNKLTTALSAQGDKIQRLQMHMRIEEEIAR